MVLPVEGNPLAANRTYPKREPHSSLWVRPLKTDPGLSSFYGGMSDPYGKLIEAFYAILVGFYRILQCPSCRATRLSIRTAVGIPLSEL